MKDDFTALDIYKALKIPRERLRAWMKLGFITPTVPAAGQGIKAIFTRTDVYCIELFKRLLDSGFNRKDAYDYLKGFIEGQEYEDCAYIFFRSEIDNGVQVLHAATVAEKEINMPPTAIDWKTGNLIISSVFPLFKQANEQWDNIHIQNFKRLKKEVDEALKGI